MHRHGASLTVIAIVLWQSGPVGPPYEPPAVSGLSSKTVTIGDSWYGNANPPYAGFYMGAYYAAHTSHKVLNLGKGGTGLDWWVTKRAEIAAAKPYALIASFGRNDFMGQAYGGVTDAEKLAAFKAFYLNCINNTKADVPGILIALETLTEQHVASDGAYHISYNANRHALNTWMFGLKAAGTIAEVIDIGGESHIGADGAMIPGTPMTDDGTHLTEAVGHPYALTAFQAAMDAFYTAHPAPTAAIISAPVLANVSSGWTTGQQPPLYQGIYPNVEGYNAIDGTGSSLRARYRIAGGSWTVTGWEGLDDELATSEAVPWAFLTDGSLNAGGVTDIQEQLGHDVGLATEELSDWSDSWTDTLGVVVSPALGIQWNPADKDSNITLSNSNRHAVVPTPTGGWLAVRSISALSGKFLFKMGIDAISHRGGVGVAVAALPLNTYAGDAQNSGAYFTNGELFGNGSGGYAPGQPSSGAGDAVTVIGDFTTPGNYRLWFAKNDVVMSGDPVAGTGGYVVPDGTYYAWLGLQDATLQWSSLVPAAISGFTAVA